MTSISGGVLVKCRTRKVSLKTESKILILQMNKKLPKTRTKLVLKRLSIEDIINESLFENLAAQALQLELSVTMKILKQFRLWI